MMPVRWLTNCSRTQCSACKSSCSTACITTNFFVGRCTASTCRYRWPTTAAAVFRVSGMTCSAFGDPSQLPCWAGGSAAGPRHCRKCASSPFAANGHRARHGAAPRDQPVCMVWPATAAPRPGASDASGSRGCGPTTAALGDPALLPGQACIADRFTHGSFASTSARSPRRLRSAAQHKLERWGGCLTLVN